MMISVWSIILYTFVQEEPKQAGMGEVLYSILGLIIGVGIMDDLMRFHFYNLDRAFPIE